MRHGPRPIDVDVLLLGDVSFESERLTLPHAQVTSRRFVLEPLLELDPESRCPARRDAVPTRRRTPLGAATAARGARPLVRPAQPRHPAAASPTTPRVARRHVPRVVRGTTGARAAGPAARHTPGRCPRSSAAARPPTPICRSAALGGAPPTTSWSIQRSTRARWCSSARRSARTLSSSAWLMRLLGARDQRRRQRRHRVAGSAAPSPRRRTPASPAIAAAPPRSRGARAAAAPRRPTPRRAPPTWAPSRRRQQPRLRHAPLQGPHDRTRADHLSPSSTSPGTVAPPNSTYCTSLWATGGMSTRRYSTPLSWSAFSAAAQGCEAGTA